MSDEQPTACERAIASVVALNLPREQFAAECTLLNAIDLLAQDRDALLDRAQRAERDLAMMTYQAECNGKESDEYEGRATKAEGDAAAMRAALEMALAFVDIYEGRALDRPRAAEVARAALCSDAGAALLAVVTAAEAWRDAVDDNLLTCNCALEAAIDALRRSRG